MLECGSKTDMFCSALNHSDMPDLGPPGWTARAATAGPYPGFPPAGGLWAPGGSGPQRSGDGRDFRIATGRCGGEARGCGEYGRG
jgi:hypothetical protein